MREKRRRDIKIKWERDVIMQQEDKFYMVNKARLILIEELQ